MTPSDALQDVIDFIEHQPDGQRLPILLALAGDLTERAAYELARIHEATPVATLILAAGHMQRLSQMLENGAR